MRYASSKIMRSTIPLKAEILLSWSDCYSFQENVPGNSLAGITKITRFVFVQIRLPFMTNSIFANHARSQATHRVECTQSRIDCGGKHELIRWKTVVIHEKRITTIRRSGTKNSWIRAFPKKLTNRLASIWLFLVKSIFSQNMQAIPRTSHLTHISQMVRKTTIWWVNRCLKGTLSA